MGGFEPQVRGVGSTTLTTAPQSFPVNACAAANVDDAGAAVVEAAVGVVGIPYVWETCKIDLLQSLMSQYLTNLVIRQPLVSHR